MSECLGKLRRRDLPIAIYPRKGPSAGPVRAECTWLLAQGSLEPAGGHLHQRRLTRRRPHLCSPPRQLPSPSLEHAQLSAPLMASWGSQGSRAHTTSSKGLRVQSPCGRSIDHYAAHLIAVDLSRAVRVLSKGVRPVVVARRGRLTFRAARGRRVPSAGVQKWAQTQGCNYEDGKGAL